MKKSWVVLVFILVFLLSCELIQDGEVSRERYKKIRLGMDFHKVKRILGKPTRVISETREYGVTTGTFAWDSKKGGMTYIIGIEDDKVKVKIPPQPKTAF